MTQELYMVGLMARDMGESSRFYRRLGLAIPEGVEHETHVSVKMNGQLTFFLDSNPRRFDPRFPEDGYPAIFEFYLESQEAVDAKYGELIGLGYQSHRAPYVTSFGMYFAMVTDPDGHVVLLSGDAARPRVRGSQ